MPSFSTPLSGLNANSQELSVIANNLANLNTVGYKADVTNFQDLFYQQIGTNGAGDPVQVGVGTQISAVSGKFTQGGIEATGVPTDVAIGLSGGQRRHQSKPIHQCDLDPTRSDESPEVNDECSARPQSQLRNSDRAQSSQSTDRLGHFAGDCTQHGQRSGILGWNEQLFLHHGFEQHAQ